MSNIALEPYSPSPPRRQSTSRVFVVLFQVVEIWRAGQNKTANTYVIEISI